MKTIILTPNGLRNAELNENRFQVWKGGAILQINSSERHSWIENPLNFRWATNFKSYEEAERNALIATSRSKMKHGLKIFSGNILYANLKNGVFEKRSEPVKQLM